VTQRYYLTLLPGLDTDNIILHRASCSVGEFDEVKTASSLHCKKTACLCLLLAVGLQNSHRAVSDGRSVFILSAHHRRSMITIVHFFTQRPTRPYKPPTRLPIGPSDKSPWGPLSSCSASQTARLPAYSPRRCLTRLSGRLYGALPYRLRRHP
jgi:hypothetical protein